jgi:hypothetical protein
MGGQDFFKTNPSKYDRYFPVFEFFVIFYNFPFMCSRHAMAGATQGVPLSN